MPGRVLLHCNAGGDYGMGHLMRCLALTEEATAQGWHAMIAGDIDERAQQIASRFAPDVSVRPTLGPDAMSVTIEQFDPSVIHLDSYWPEADALHLPGTLLSNMQDGEFGVRPAELAIDANLGAEEWYQRPEVSRHHLAGVSAAIIRQQVRSRRGARSGPNERPRVLIVLGGTDPMNLTTRVVAALAAVDAPLTITVICPPLQHDNLTQVAQSLPHDVVIRDFVDDLPALAVTQDLVISASGTSVWDFACLSVPMALVCVTENQVRGYRAAIEAGIARGLGGPDHSQLEQNVAELGALLQDAEALRALGDHAGDLVDGDGAWRIVASWEQLITSPPRILVASQLEARAATLDDARMLLEWRNDEATRSASRSTELVEWKSHRAWLERVLADPTRLLLVVERAGEPVGTVRWDLIHDCDWEVSITLAPHARGRGLAPHVLDSGERALPHGQTVRLVAAIHADNAASRALFVRAGYLPRSRSDAEGFSTYEKLRFA